VFKDKNIGSIEKSVTGHPTLSFRHERLW